MSTEDEKFPEGSTDSETPVQEELSLEQLSQAYAQVMREQGQPFDEDAEFEPEGDADAEDQSEENSSEANSEAEKYPDREKKQKSPEEIDAEDNASCPISPKSIVEAILFVGVPAGVKMTGKKLAAVMRDVSPKEVKKIVKELNNDYEASNAAFRIVEESGDFKLKLTEDLLEVQNHFFGRNRPAKLSQGRD